MNEKQLLSLSVIDSLKFLYGQMNLILEWFWQEKPTDIGEFQRKVEYLLEILQKHRKEWQGDYNLDQVFTKILHLCRDGPKRNEQPDQVLLGAKNTLKEWLDDYD